MTGSHISRAAVGSQIAELRAPRRGRVRLVAAVFALALVLAALWTFVAQRQLQRSILDEATQHVDQAAKAFDGIRTSARANLLSHCRVLVEDPRLKSTLATEGMDEATVADILNDLGKLRGSGFLMVLTPEGRVFAEAGAPGLRGLDLSESSVVKSAKESADAVVGSWVLQDRVMDLSVMVIRYDESIVAYLVVGQSLDEALLEGVADQTGVEVASVLADAVVLSSEAGMKPVFAGVAGRPAGFRGAVTIEGETYAAGVVELPGSVRPHRLVLARPLERVMPVFQRLQWMLFVPPLLVLVSVLLAASGMRVPRRTR
jgi:hypothetical protein